MLYFKTVSTLLLLLQFICGNLANLDQLTNKIESWYISRNSREYDEKSIIKIYKEDNSYKKDTPETINLIGNDFHVIQDNIIRSDAVRYIILRNNLLTSIPEKILDNVPNALYLDLSKNSINLFKRNPIAHNNLEGLDLSYQNIPLNDPMKYENVENDLSNEEKYIEKLFNCEGMYLPNLKRLILDGNHISGITKDFNKCFPSLTHFYLNNIKAISLGSEFFHYIPQTLHSLYFESNMLTNLTLNIVVGGISYLYLDKNLLLENVVIDSKDLQVLSLADNKQLESLTLNLPNLNQLDISGCTSLDMNTKDSVSYRELQTLVMKRNELTEISLPLQTIIKELSLANNWITYVPAMMFRHLTSLKKLSLSTNHIKVIEQEAFNGLKNLQFLDLSYNSLTNLPSNWIPPFAKMEYLNINANYIESIGALNLTDLSKLSHVSVKSNKFLQISNWEMTFLPHAITVYI